MEGAADARAEGRARCVIAISAASLNFPDLLIVQNKYQMKPPLPFVPGSEYAGPVEAVGEGVTHLKVGDAVAAFGGTGGFGTHAVVDAGARDAAADGLCRSTTPRRSSSPTARRTTRSSTAAQLQGRRDAARPRRGRRRRHGGDPDRQGARRARHRRRVERREVRAAAARIGADATINYAQRQHPRRAEAADRRQGRRRRLRPGRRRPRRAGVPLDRLARPLPRRRLRPGPIPALPLNLALLKGASIVGVFWGEFARREPKAQRARRWPSSRAGTREGKVKPVIDRRLPMSELPAAYARDGQPHGARQARDDQRLTRPARSRGTAIRTDCRAGRPSGGDGGGRVA